MRRFWKWLARLAARKLRRYQTDFDRLEERILQPMKHQLDAEFRRRAVLLNGPLEVYLFPMSMDGMWVSDEGELCGKPETVVSFGMWAKNNGLIWACLAGDRSRMNQPGLILRIDQGHG